MFKGQTYNGSSFLEFLRTDHPQLLPNFDRSDWRGLELLKATTVLALVYEDGVLMRGPLGDRGQPGGHARHREGVQDR